LGGVCRYAQLSTHPHPERKGVYKAGSIPASGAMPYGRLYKQPIYMLNTPIILSQTMYGHAPALWSADGELIGVICPTQEGVVNIANQVNSLLIDHYPDGALLPDETNISFGWADSFVDLYVNYTEDLQSEIVRLTWVRVYN